jgi:MerR HTH family regulatory protein
VVPGQAIVIPTARPPRAVERKRKADVGRLDGVKPLAGPGAQAPGPHYACRKRFMTTPTHQANSLDDDDFPAYTMGRAAELIGSTPAFLRALGDARLITPLRSDGGHRRYSRYQLRIASRAREMVDAGTPIDAACRIIILEDQLEEALRLNTQHHHPGTSAPPATVT